MSQSVAQRLFPDGDALNRQMWWTDPYFGPNRCRGASSVSSPTWTTRTSSASPAMTVYHPVPQIGLAAGCSCARRAIHTRWSRRLRVSSAIFRPTSRSSARRRSRTSGPKCCRPIALNAFVFSGFAGIALLIAVVGVAGVLAFSVSARTREFGVRLAIGSAPRHLLTRVLTEGVRIAAAGIAAGIVGGYALSRAAAGVFGHIPLPGALTVIGAAAVLAGAAVTASLMPAARAARVDVLQALRSE